jgi:PIN domain
VVSVPTPQTYTLIVDANILYSNHDDRIFSKEFEKCLAECRKFAVVRLLIPRVAFLELLFRRIKKASKLHGKAKAELANVMRFSRSTEFTFLDESDVILSIYKEACHWKGNNKATLVRTPIDSINWAKLIRKSIWRLPPFEPYSDDSKKNEKGFRDALVVETVEAIIRRSHSSVIFVSGDDLLRKTIEQHSLEFPATAKITCYKSSAELLSAMKLNTQPLSDFLKNILLGRANALFYTKGDTECIFSKDGLAERAQGFSFYYFPILSHMFADPSSDAYHINYTPVGSPVVVPGDTLFEELDESGTYYWASIVNLAQSFVIAPTQDNYLLVVAISVKWSCNFDEEGNHSNIQIKDPTFAYVTSDKVTAEEMLSLESTIRERGMSWDEDDLV